MSDLLLDVRYAFRQIRRRPVFTVVAALSLAIGVGANTAIFSAARALLLRPVSGVSSPDRVVELGRTRDGGGFDTFSYPDYADLRDGVAAFERTAAFTIEIFSFSRGETGERITGMHVSADYFAVMGVEPGQGRFFAAADDAAGAPGDVVVLGHGFWADRLGGDPAVVGSTVRVNRQPFTVIGVAPREFRGHVVGIQPDVYLPLRTSPLLRERADIWEARNSSWHQAVARLAPDATLGLAREQVRAVMGRLSEAYPESNARRGAEVVPLGLVPGGARGGVGAFMGVLMAMVGLILVVTCVNVAGMFLARGSAREKEIAVRLAIGSGRGRLIRQLLTEALVVFAIGGAVGGLVGARLLALTPVDRLPVPIQVTVDLSPDLWVLGFALGVTLLTGLVFGLLPALKATRLDLVPSLKDEGGRRRTGLMRRVFVGGQVGLSLVLLVSAGLLARSLQRAAAVETGFDATDAYVTGVDLALEGYDDDAGPSFQRRLLESVRAVPGVEAAGLASDLPLDMGSRGTVAYPEGYDADEGRLGVDFNQVSPGYFEALSIRLVEGRDFTDEDVEGAGLVVIVSRELAQTVWPGESALGRQMRVFGSSWEPRVVVGVVDDVLNQLVTEARKPFVYLPLAQSYRSSTQVVARVAPGMSQVATGLRGAILAEDPSLSLSPVIALERYTSVGLLPQRLAASITGVLGAFALLLAGLGVYGVVAFAVHQQTREIGVRMALGAGERRILQRVLGSGLMLALPGIVLGGAAALAAGRLLRFLLLGLSPADPVALASVGGLLLLVVTVASLVPALRASRVQPVTALRSE